MRIIVEISFPLGRYHATPWDAAANSGAVEWPPSPWRILRALLAVAHARSEDVDTVVGLLGRLGNPAAYEAADGTAGSTRHYLPDDRHRTAGRGGTDLVLDGYISIAHRDSQPDLRIHWDVELDDDEVVLLRRLVDNLPYLGRSESVCVATIATQSARPDETWWRIGEVGGDVESVELLGAAGTPTREELEATTDRVRSKLRVVYPPGTRLIGYGRHRRVGVVRRGIRAGGLSRHGHTALRLELHGAASIRMRDFLMPTDRAHRSVRKVLDGLDDPREAAAIIGKDGDRPRQNHHDHLHVIAVPKTVDSRRFDGDQPIGSLILWTPRGMSDQAVDRIGRRFTTLWTSQRITENSFPTQRILTAGVGTISEVAAELLDANGGSLRWRSATPYFPVRHRKRESVEEWIRKDLTKELGYRRETSGLEVVDISVDDTRDTAAALMRFRKRRLAEAREDNRRGYYVDITVSREIAGPLMLGQLSHFGAGLFVPVTGRS